MACPDSESEDVRTRFGLGRRSSEHEVTDHLIDNRPVRLSQGVMTRSNLVLHSVA